MVCANPDLVSVTPEGELVICPGTVARRYEAIGGFVRWHGKPDPAVYAHCRALYPEAQRPLGIGDRLLGPETAESIWRDCNALLARPEFSARGIMRQMSPMVQWIAKGLRNRFGPFQKFLPIRGIACAISFGHARRAHRPPFVVIAGEPNPCQIFEAMIFGNLSRFFGNFFSGFFGNMPFTAFSIMRSGALSRSLSKVIDLMPPI